MSLQTYIHKEIQKKKVTKMQNNSKNNFYFLVFEIF